MSNFSFNGRKNHLLFSLFLITNSPLAVTRKWYPYEYVYLLNKLVLLSNPCKRFNLTIISKNNFRSYNHFELTLLKWSQQQDKHRNVIRINTTMYNFSITKIIEPGIINLDYFSTSLISTFPVSTKYISTCDMLKVYFNGGPFHSHKARYRNIWYKRLGLAMMVSNSINLA